MTKIENALKSGIDGPSSAAASEAAGAFARRAAKLGLVDVAYAVVDSPVGELLVAATPAGVVRVSFDFGVDEALSDLARRISPRVLEVPSRLDHARRQFDEYFAGKRRAFDLPVDLRLAAGFRRRVLDALSGVDYGTVVTYREVAAKAGNDRAVRAAGNAVGANPVPIVVPCHRVVRTGGGLGGYGGGVERKRLLLELEGVL